MTRDRPFKSEVERVGCWGASFCAWTGRYGGDTLPSEICIGLEMTKTIPALLLMVGWSGRGHELVGGMFKWEAEGIYHCGVRLDSD